VDELFRKAERQGEDLDKFRRRAGLFGFRPKSRVEFPVCPITGCSHESGSLSTDYCRNEKCYLVNWVTIACERLTHQECKQIVTHDVPMRLADNAYDPAGLHNPFMFLCDYTCLCPCHADLYEDWLKRFSFIPEVSRVYNRNS